MPRCSMRGPPGHADHLRAVVAAPGRVGRRPRRARVGRADADALVGVDGRRHDRRDGVRVMDQARDEVVGVVGEAVAVAVALALEEVRLARRVPQREVEVAAVAREVAEGLRHERRQLAALLGHDVDHVAEEDRAIACDERVVVGEVRLELAVRVLVVVRVVAIAELVRVARERRQELVVAVQRLGVVAGLLARVERVVDDEPAVLVLAYEEELRLEAHLEAESERGRPRHGVAEDRARAVRPGLALDRHVAGEAHELGLPRDARVRRDVRHGEHVGRGGRLADRAGREAGEAGALLEQVVDRLHGHELRVGLAVHLDELREEELDSLVLRALADLVVRHSPASHPDSRWRAYRVCARR